VYSSPTTGLPELLHVRIVEAAQSLHPPTSTSKGKQTEEVEMTGRSKSEKYLLEMLSQVFFFQAAMRKREYWLFA